MYLLYNIKYFIPYTDIYILYIFKIIYIYTTFIYNFGGCIGATTFTASKNCTYLNKDASVFAYAYLNLY